MKTPKNLGLFASAVMSLASSAKTVDADDTREHERAPKVLDARAERRRQARQVEKTQRSKAKIAHRRARGADLRNRIRDREARELQSTAGYQLPLLAARTAVGRLRRFMNEDGKMVRLA